MEGGAVIAPDPLPVNGPPCYEMGPDGNVFCTLVEWHKGDHYSWVARLAWPSDGQQPTRLGRRH